MFSALTSLWNWLLIHLRGPTQVTCHKTDKTFHRVYHVQPGENNAHGGNVQLYCEELCHRVQYKRLLIPARCYHTYVVKITIYNSIGEMQTIPDMVFPRLCTTFLAWSVYPNVCAIKAGLDRLIDLNYL